MLTIPKVLNYPGFGNLRTFASIKASYSYSYFHQKKSLQKHLIQNDRGSDFFKNLRHNEPKCYGFCSSKENICMVQSLNEVQKGNAFANINKYHLALIEYLSALEFLPTEGDQRYQQSYYNLLFKCVRAHVKSGKSVQELNFLDENVLEAKTKEFIRVLRLLESSSKGSKDLEELLELKTDTEWKNLVKIQAFKLSDKPYESLINLENLEISNDFAVKYLGFTFFEQIPARKDSEIQNKYVDGCKKLLQEAEQMKGSPKIVKPIILTATNIMAGGQYMQPEGLISYCLDAKSQLLQQNKELLKLDQEYLLCQLKMARVLENVGREAEAERIKAQFGPLFDERKFFVQEIVDINFESL